MKENRDYLEMSFRSIQCFADDGTLDAQELEAILSIAERDGVVDANEIRVLKNIIGRINPEELNDSMKAKLTEIQSKLEQS